VLTNSDFISVSKIYDEIYLEESSNVPEHKRRDRVSRDRVYRSKFSTLLKLLCCANENYKNNKKAYEVFEQDSHVVKYIIKEAVNTKALIAKWFNGHIDKFSNEDIVGLYENFESKIKRIFAEKKIDQVRMNEWLGAINTIFDYSTAKRIIEIESLLKDFRINTLPLTNHIAVGEITATDETSYSWVAIEAKVIEDKEDKIPKFNKEQYLEQIYYILQKYNIEAKEKSHKIIKDLTEFKITFDASGTSDDYLDDNSKEIASTYVLRDYNIQRYLIERPDIW